LRSYNRRATPPATIKLNTEPETPFALAAPVAKAMGLPVAVVALTTPVDATTTGVAMAAVEEATPGTETTGVELASHAKTVTVTVFSAKATEAMAAKAMMMLENCILTVVIW